MDKIINALEKIHGKNIVTRLSHNIINREVINTGSIGLDHALGGGIVKGRVIELYGVESSGKTTIALHMIANVQKAGGTVLFIDSENSFDIQYATNLGVNVDNLLFSQPSYAEQAFEIIEAFVNEGGVDLIILDSIAAMPPRAELDGSSGDSNMGLMARLLGQHLRKVTTKANESKTTLVYVNQIRDKLGVTYGPHETTPGGKALKFLASARIEVRKIETIKDGDNIVGIKSKAKVTKNKMAAPFKTAEFQIIFGKGINYTDEVIDAAVQLGIIIKKGSWYSYNETQIGQGKEAVEVYIKERKLVDELVEKINTKRCE